MVFIKEYQYALEVRNVILVSDVAPGIVINGRREMIETVLENLMDNAISFSPKGGRVTVSLAKDADAVLLRIMDEGPGVNPHRLPRIFDRYYSSRPQTGEPSTNPSEAHFGIGLWLVRQNVQAMGGTVQAENRPARDPSATPAVPGGFSITVKIPTSPTA